MRRVKIEGGICGIETHIYDVLTGKEIENVVDVRITMDPKGSNKATIVTHSFEKVEVERIDIEAQGEIEGEQETIVPDVKQLDGKMRFSFAGWNFTTPGGEIHDLFMIKLGNLVDEIKKKDRASPSGGQLKNIGQQVEIELKIRLDIEMIESAKVHICKIARKS